MIVKCTGGDAVARNYLLHTYDGVKWAFTVYDADTWFGIEWGGAGNVADDFIPTMLGCASENHLFRYLIGFVPEKIVARYNELVSGALSASNIAETVLDFTAQIPKAVFDAEVVRWPGMKTTETNNANQIIDHIRAREPIVSAEVARLDAPSLKAKATWYDTAAAGAEMNTITDINFDPDYKVTGDEDASWDCSVWNDGSIMAYRTGTTVTVKPTKHKYIRLAKDSSYMFANDGTNASFSVLARITGTEIFTANYGTSMQGMCHNTNKLTTAVCIPEGVTNIIGAFRACWVLRETPKIPNGVFYMSSIFDQAGILTMPQIPESVLEMDGAFAGVQAANLPRKIPKGVISMNRAFRQCYKASGFMVIETTKVGTKYELMFENASRDSDGIIITGPCPALAELAATNTQGKVTVLE